MTRLPALAHRFEKLIRDSEVRDYADLARLGHVTRARVSQVMDLLLLAPDIQEEILALPAVEAGHDTIHERRLRQIVAVADWRKQRRMWACRILFGSGGGRGLCGFQSASRAGRRKDSNSLPER